MNLVRRTGDGPRPLARLQDEMDNLFRRFFDDWDWLAPAPLRGTWWPTMEVAEHDDRITVKAELPGVKNEDVEVSVLDDTLTVSGEKKESQEDKGDGYYHSERRYGSFRRDIRLPASVDANKVEATYRDGVLTITLPKTEQAKAKRIPVKT